jgi:hypothetical protein
MHGFPKIKFTGIFLYSKNLILIQKFIRANMVIGRGVFMGTIGLNNKK